MEKLSKLSELLDKGHITQEEFEAQKVKLLQ
ncbi:SHOCT domain-containing protein [Hydrogenimonas thermophila]